MSGWTGGFFVMIFLDAHMCKLTLIQPLKFDTCLGILLPQCPNTQTHTQLPRAHPCLGGISFLVCKDILAHFILQVSSFTNLQVKTLTLHSHYQILETLPGQERAILKQRIIPKNRISGKCNKKTLISTWKQHFEAQLSTAQLGFSRTLNCGSRALFRTVQSGKNSE